MDPMTILLMVGKAIEDGDHETARELLAAYRGWRARGGFEPYLGNGIHGDHYASCCHASYHASA